MIPTVRVQLAFADGPDVWSPAWTDVTADLDADAGVSWSRGRPDEHSAVAPGGASFTIRNDDGTYTPGRVASIVPLRQVQISAHDGVDWVKVWRGHVDAWTLGWLEDGARCVVAVTATECLARLGLARPLRSTVTEEWMADPPQFYWPLTEPSGAQSWGNLSTYHTNAMSKLVPPSAGTESEAFLVKADDNPATTSTESYGTNRVNQYLRSPGDPEPGMMFRSVSWGQTMLRSRTNHWGHTGQATTEACVWMPAWLGQIWSDAAIIAYLDDSQHRVVYLGVENGYFAVTHWRMAGFATSAANNYVVGGSISGNPALYVDFAAGSRAYHLAWTEEVVGQDVTTQIWVDGVLAHSETHDHGSPSAAHTARAHWTSIGGVAKDTWCDPNQSPPSAGRWFTGVISHVARRSRLLDPARIAAHSEAFHNGGQGQRSDERLATYFRWLGTDPARLDLQTGSATLCPRDTTGASVLECIDDVVAAERGAFFAAGDGKWTFRARNAQVGAPTSLVLDAGAEQVQADFAPVIDMSAVVNDLHYSRPNAAQGRTINQVSIDRYGQHAGPETTTWILADDEQAYAAAALKVAVDGIPRVRAGTVSVDLAGLDQPSTAAALAVQIGELLRITGLPPTAPSDEYSCHAEHLAATVTATSATLTFTVSSAAWAQLGHWDEGTWDDTMIWGM